MLFPAMHTSFTKTEPCNYNLF